MFEPLVSIIIPVYNGSNYLREAVDSALAQTYENKEIIVVNDGSKDNGETHKIALSFGNKIRYFEKENGGVSSALNKGIKEMKGEYFSWLSHDDVYYPDKIKKQVEALEHLDKNTIIYCANIHIDEKSEKISGYKFKSYFEPYREYNSEEALEGLLKKSTFNGCGLLIPKKVLIECGMFDESLRFCQDAFMWYKIFIKGNSLFCLNDVLVMNRIHANQLTQTGQALFLKECNEISDYLSKAFFEISTKEYNFLKLYLFSDAKFLEFSRIKGVIEKGERKKLFTKRDKLSVYLLFIYGRFRPYVRKFYYKFIRNIRTN